MKFGVFSTIVFTTFLSACQTIDSGIKPDDVVDELNAEINFKQKTWNSQAAALDFNNDNWLFKLNDERLLEFVDIALKNNFSLVASEARLAAQLESARISAANLLPTVGLSVNASRGQSEQPVPSENGQKNTSNVITSNNFSGNLNVSWEIDVWNRLSAQTKSSNSQVQATAADYQAARLSLVASVARAWFNINSIKLQIDIEQNSLLTIKEALEVVEEQYLNGSQSALNVYLGRTEANTQKARIIELQNTLNTAIRDFKVLLGEYPDISLSFDANLPSLDSSVPAGLPSELIMRRPDVLADFYTWQSSEYDTDAAERALYPSFSLTASLGNSSDSLSTLDEKSLLLNLMGGLTQPIFQAGRLKAQVRANEYLAFASFKQYIATLLASFNEVESALASENSLTERLTLLNNVESLANAGFNLALDQYTGGISTYDTLLDARSRWINAQLQVVSLQNALLQNRISLNLALGGDFDTTSENILERLSLQHIEEQTVSSQTMDSESSSKETNDE